MATTTQAPGTDATEGDRAVVDPRAPRLGQAITSTGLVAGIVLDVPALIFAVAAILLTAVVSRWQFDAYGLLWRAVASRFVDPVEPEPAAPHRFAKLLGATGTTIASGLILADFPLAGYLVAGAIALAAGLAATTGICLGCRMYRSVSFFRRLDVV